PRERPTRLAVETPSRLATSCKSSKKRTDCYRSFWNDLTVAGKAQPHQRQRSRVIPDLSPNIQSLRRLRGRYFST
ncbi:hypothetical protein MTO96_043510, partial [Rhipicephalus appendiculatus]